MQTPYPTPALPSSRYGDVSSSDKTLWQQIISDWKHSGMTQKTFCDTHGLNKNTLSYWRGKFLATAKPSAPSGKSFAPIHINASRFSLSESSIQLQTPEGYVFSIPLATSDKVLARLLSILGVSHA